MCLFVGGRAAPVRPGPSRTCPHEPTLSAILKACPGATRVRRPEPGYASVASVEVKMTPGTCRQPARKWMRLRAVRRQPSARRSLRQVARKWMRLGAVLGSEDDVGMHAGNLHAEVIFVMWRGSGRASAPSLAPSPSSAPSMGAGLHAGSPRSAFVGAVRGSEGDADNTPAASCHHRRLWHRPRASGCMPASPVRLRGRRPRKRR
jgi:hypothetical protein